MLSKVRHFVSFNTLKSIYHAILESIYHTILESIYHAILESIYHAILKSIYHAILEIHLNYSLTVWAQNANSIKRHLFLQKKSLRIMHLLKRNKHTSNLFKNLNILKLPDKVSLENCIFICKYFNQSLPKSFKNWVTLATASHTHNNRWSNSGCLLIKRKYVYTRNYLQKLHVNILFYQLPLTKLKILIKKFYTTNYN